MSGNFWDREVLHQQHVSWMEDPVIHEYVNTLIGGGTPCWPFDQLERWLGGRRFEHGLSIGCGTGALERDVVRRGICKSVDAFDGSLTSLHIARAEAVAAGIADRIHYFAANFDYGALPRRKYDIVFFHQSAHHVSELERLFHRVLLALKPNGLLYLDEYVGPSRTEWTDALLSEQRAVFAALPAEVRAREDLPYPIQDDDPSEAVRSGEIEKFVNLGFDVIHRRPYGGTLLSVIFPLLRRDAPRELIDRLIEQEKALLAAGRPTYYAILLAKPKRGVRRLLAHIAFLRSRRQRNLSSRA